MECATSPDFFALNENIGKVPESSVKNQQVVIAAPAQAVVAIQNPVVPLSAIQPAFQAQAVAASSTATASIAAAQAVQVSYQAEPAIDAPVLIALEPVKAVAVPEPAAAVILPAAVEIPVPVEISAPVVLSIADAPIQLTVSQEVRYSILFKYKSSNKYLNKCNSTCTPISRRLNKLNLQYQADFTRLRLLPLVPLVLKISTKH